MKFDRWRRGARQFGVIDALQKLLEQHGELCDRERRANAEMSACGEREMPVRLPADLELIWILEYGFITVSGWQPDGNLVAFGDVQLADLRVFRCGTQHMQHGAREPQDLLYCGGHERRAGAQALPLVREADECEQSPYRGVPGRLVPGGEKGVAIENDLFVGERDAIYFTVNQGADNIVSWIAPAQSHQVLVVAQDLAVGRYLYCPVTAGSERGHGEPEQLLPVLLRYPEQIADHRDGKAGRHLDGVALPGGDSVVDNS